jgi:hypothetical protein
MRTPPRPPLLFLSWESPWPAHSGAALRTLGLLSELGQRYFVDLVVLTRRELPDETTARLGDLAQNVTLLRLRDVSTSDKLRALRWIVGRRYPYHGAILESSLAEAPTVRRKTEDFPGVVFTSIGHWGTLIRGRPSSNWVLNQCDRE